MVGVPGRSKACHTCRQRRIRCGSEKPKCLNCLKSSRLCTGYQRNHAFVLSKDMVGLESKSGVPKSQDPSPKTSSSSEKLPRLMDESDSGPILVSRWRISHDNSSSTPPIKKPVFKSATIPINDVQALKTSLRTIHSITPQHAFRDQLLHVFLQTHLPVDFTLKCGQTITSRRNFLLQLPDIPNVSPAMEYALLAVCTARIGRMDGSMELVHRSLSLYTESLRELQRAVLDPATRYDDQTLATCMILSMYEFTECPSRAVHGYNTHFVGAMNLLRLRGPNAHVSGLAHAIFFAIRVHSVYHSLGDHVRSFISSPEWRTTPFTSSPKGLYDELTDIQLELPELYAQSDRTDTQTDACTTLAQVLETTQLNWRLDRDLAAWYARFESSIAGPPYHPELATLDSTTDSPELGKLFPVAFRFAAWSVAQTMMMYWIALLIEQCHLNKLYRQLRRVAALLREMGDIPCTCHRGNSGAEESVDKPDGEDETIVLIDAGEEGTAALTTCPQHFTTARLPPLRHRERPRAIAHKVCQSVEYFLDDRMGCLGASIVLPALITVRGCLTHFDGDTDRERVWIKEMLGRVAKKGNKLAAYL